MLPVSCVARVLADVTGGSPSAPLVLTIFTFCSAKRIYFTYAIKVLNTVRKSQKALFLMLHYYNKLKILNILMLFHFYYSVYACSDYNYNY